MTQTSPVIPKAAVRGTASGVLFLSFFGALWAGLGFIGLEGWGIPWLLIIAVLVSVALCVGGFSLRSAAGQLTDQVTAENAHYWKRAGRWFTIVFATQGIAIGVTSAICGATGHYELILPLTALIVGVHFLPLAPLFRVKSYYITGTLLCVLSVITLLTVPSTVTLHGEQILLWWVIVGFGSALILWTTGLSLFLAGRRLLRVYASVQQMSVQNSLA